jgi:prepilin-type N-terminal cleavage/methylation domain-containing protein
MRKLPHSKSRAFTLVEIMIVVAILAILATLAVSNYMRARKRAEAAKVLDDLRLLDGALDQYALENNKLAGDPVDFTDLQPYLILSSQTAIDGTDLFGQPYGPYTVDITPKVAPFTFSALSDVAPPSFWSPYY